MAREYRILHHRQAVDGGHWDLAVNPLVHRSAHATVASGEGSLCTILEHLAEEGWMPVLDLSHTQVQAGETILLLSRS